MDAAQQNTLRYFKTALEQANLPKVEYSEKERYMRLSDWSAKAVQNGQLSEKVREELFEAYFKKYKVPKKKRSDIRTIGIILSLVSAEKDDEAFGLLNMACNLSRTGELTTNQEPWIPYDRLLSDDVDPSNIVVGELSTFWDFKRETSEEFKKKAKTWQDYIEYAQMMLDQVFTDVSSRFEDSGEELIASDIYIKPENYEPENRHIIDFYKRLLDEEEAPKLLQNIMTPKNSHESAQDIDAGEKRVANMLSEYASMNKNDALNEAYRWAVHAFAGMGEGDVLAVSAPSSSGEDKIAVLQSTVADLLVQHALDKKPAPLIVATCADSEDVVDLIHTFSCKATEDPTLLDVRWLPVYSQQSTKEEKVFKEQVQSDEEQEDETPIDPLQTVDSLKSFAVYCSDTSAAIDDDKFELIEDVKKEGIYSQYSSRAYVENALRAIQLFAGALLGDNLADLQTIQAHLYEWLIVLDKVRQGLIKAVGDFRSEFTSLLGKVDKEDEQPIDTFDKQIKQANEHCSMAQKLLDYWTQMDQSRETKGVFRKTAIVPDEDFIAENKNQHDSFDESLKTVEEIKNYYEKELEEQKGIVSNTKAMRNAYTQKLDAYNEALQLAKSCLEQLTGDKAMSKRIDKFDRNSNLYDEDLPVKLDELLDITLRYAQFWLGMHYYECQWLIDCTTLGRIVKPALRHQRSEEIQSTYWSQITSLAPCFVMMPNQLPQYFMLYKKGKQVPDLERIDLLVIDEAEQIITPVVLGSFALAKKALVIGDASQLRPIWSFTTEIDENIAKNNGVVDDWQKRGQNGLTASAPSNMMRAAMSACIWDFDSPENEEQESQDQS